MEKILINHKEFFRFVLNGIIELSNEAESNVFTSWKVGGQDFYIYGRNPTLHAPDAAKSAAELS